ncbi:MAG: energy-coupling factor transporter transmembrane component T family protein [Promethearchaeota archaeon]
MAEYGGYRKADTILHRLDPRVKLLWFIGFTLPAISWNDPVFLSILLIVILIMGSIATLSLRTMGGFLKPLIPMLVMIVIFNQIFYEWQIIPEWPVTRIGYLIPQFTILSIWTIGPWIPVSIESIVYTSSNVIRFIIIVLAARIMMTFTSPTDIAVAISKLHAPPEFATAISISFGYIPVLHQQVNAIFEAQKCRGWKISGRNPFSKLRSFIPTLLPIIIRSFARSEYLAAAIVSRGFGYSTKRTYCNEPKIERRDFFAIMILLFIIIFSQLIGVWALGFVHYRLTTFAVKGILALGFLPWFTTVFIPWLLNGVNQIISWPTSFF